jgi:hypothetical protein
MGSRGEALVLPAYPDGEFRVTARQNLLRLLHASLPDRPWADGNGLWRPHL